MEKLYYSAFYSLPKFGKTRLGQFLLHGKSGQNRELIHEIVRLTRPQVEKIIKRHSIQAIAYVPHSIPRKIPFLKEYRDNLNLSLPEISIIKVFAGKVPIAQKSLSKLSERVENASSTIFAPKLDHKFKNILIIDDALGSGATINELARKLKKKGTKIFGYAIVGSYKGFEVIQEA